MQNRIESLHNHTTNSDGKMACDELFSRAQASGMSVLAITDHDAVPTDEMLQYLEGKRDSATKWIIGTEITARLPEGATASSSLHLIGLFVDPRDSGLQQHAKLAQSARIERMKTMVMNLRSLGYQITEDDCLRASHGESVGRPHIVEALALYEQNDQVTAGLVEQVSQRALYDQQVAAKYKDMLLRGERSYLYDLVLSHHALFPGYVEISYMPTFEQAVAMVRNAGGIASIAHYFTVSKYLSLAMIEALLRQGELDGMEVVYGLNALGTEFGERIHSERKQLIETVRNACALATGGGDIHTVEDLGLYVNAQELSAESVGFTDQIIRSGKVDTRWSSLG